MPIDPRAPAPVDPRAVQADKLAGLERRLAALERAGTTVAGLTALVDPFVNVGDAGAPAFQNSWQNWSGGPTFMVGGFMRDPFGFVHLRGVLNRGAAALTVSTIFTLPVGYRPLLSAAHPATTSGAYGRIDITNAGAVNLALGTLGPGGASSYAILDGIIFKAEQ